MIYTGEGLEYKVEKELVISYGKLHPKYIELIETCYHKVGEEIYKAPASTKYHHSYEGGLAEHLAEVYDLVQVIGEYYPDKANMSILKTAALLHDIGKPWDYEDNVLKSGNISRAVPYRRTIDSKQMSHLGRSMFIALQAAAEIDFPLIRLEPILHCIASHHGEVRRGWGSLIDPATVEAHILHHADMISSRVAPFGSIELPEKAKKEEEDGDK